MAIIYEKRDKIAYLTINRPEKLNSVDRVTQREILDAMADFDRDPDCWVLILTGAGDRAFSAGGDLTEWDNSVKEAGPDVLRRVNTEPETWKITIAAINGIAIGGGMERALRCDFRVMADHARVRFSEVRLSLIPPYGSLKLPRMIAPIWAAEAMLMADWIAAEEAYRIGLVNRVVPGPQLLDAATQMAHKINEAGPLAVRTLKRILYASQDMTIEQASWYSDQAYRELMLSEDAKEGARAFVEKRKAVFRAR